MIPNTYSLNQAEHLYLTGAASLDELTDYLHRWNASPHFSQAGLVRTFDPEKSNSYSHLYAQFGVKAE